MVAEGAAGSGPALADEEDWPVFGERSAMKSPSNFAPKDWYEATNVCAAEGKVLCGVDEPCKGKGCLYDREYQWTGEECQAGDAGLPAACTSA